MKPFEQAYDHVLNHAQDFGEETVALNDCMNRILAENVKADRDFPPFDRATKDGIAIQFEAIEEGITRFKVEGIVSAGAPRQELSTLANCLEIMTGAVMPQNADTVIMYEDITMEDGYAQLSKVPSKGQEIHFQGSDEKKGSVLLEIGTRVGPAEIGVLATVGKSEVSVKGLPKACVISTGNELVDVSEIPLPHQIRKSNSISLMAALSKEHINASLLHLDDDKKDIENGLKGALEEHDVLLLSGGVSKGKYDYVPEVMETLGVQKIFHGVAQRPGKPFWFGMHPTLKTVVFSFPGNPVSTFTNYHVYFLPWLQKSLDLAVEPRMAILGADFTAHRTLTLFPQVKCHWKAGSLFVRELKVNGSGDVASLTKSDGFICLKPKEGTYRKGELVRLLKWEDST